jgi:3-(3-hydroxy-phenyl)propionate hydroxylase
MNEIHEKAKSAVRKSRCKMAPVHGDAMGVQETNRMSTPLQTSGYELPTYPFVTPPELSGAPAQRYPVVIIGAGLCGLTAACDFASRGIRAVVLDDDDTIGVRGASSRGIVYAQKTLEIMDRLGLYERLREKGITWSVGKTLAGTEVVYEFDASSQSASKQPPFINIQQFYLEWFLVDRITEIGNTDLRWKNKVAGYQQFADHARIEVETPAGSYALEADWVLDCSGVNSFVRDTLKLDTHPARGIDRWCISDVRFKAPLPIERWTWVEAPFNDNRAVWQHLMADDVWRLDFQMDPECDTEYVSRLDVAAERVRKQVGDDVEFELVWVGPYSYRSQLLDQFRVGRTFFLGDSAHVMSPFGARGGNSAIQDADNLCWKLALVLAGEAPESLLDTYHAERRPAAQFNIMTTRRTSRFLSPETPQEKLFRDAAISLAREYTFARNLVNTGRLSAAFTYADSPLCGDAQGVALQRGSVVQNAPITLPDGKPGVLADLFRDAPAYVGLWLGRQEVSAAEAIRYANQNAPRLRMLQMGGADLGLSGIADPDGRLARALCWDGKTPAFVLLRPDMHLATALSRPSIAAIRRAYARARGQALPQTQA